MLYRVTRTLDDRLDPKKKVDFIEFVVRTDTGWLVCFGYRWTAKVSGLVSVWYLLCTR